MRLFFANRGKSWRRHFRFERTERPSLALIEVVHYCNDSATEVTEITEKLASFILGVVCVRGGSLPHFFNDSAMAHLQNLRFGLV
jgi:hypothetical protein